MHERFGCVADGVLPLRHAGLHNCVPWEILYQIPETSSENSASHKLPERAEQRDEAEGEPKEAVVVSVGVVKRSRDLDGEVAQVPS